MKTDLERFEGLYIPEPNSGCWLWIGTSNENGYGRFRQGKVGKKVPAHRWAYEHKYGRIPDTLETDHLCRVPSCVNPDHIEPVTRRENLRRAILWAGNKTHCKNGHEFVADNTLMVFSKFYNSFQRVCLECKRKSARATATRIRQKRKSK